MKILAVGDVHWAEKESLVQGMGKKYSKRLENLIASVNWCEQLAEGAEVDYVIYLGDFFHKSVLNAEEITSLRQINWSNKPHLFLVGNHDASNSSLEFNAVNVLCSVGEVVSAPKYLGDLFDCNILLIPYQTEDNLKPLKEYTNQIDNSKKTVLFSHNSIKGIRYGKVQSSKGFDISDIEEHCDLFINGHLHNCGFVNTAETILNLGILSGLDFKEDALTYPHLVTVLDTSDLSLKFYKNPQAFNFFRYSVTTDKQLQKLVSLITSEFKYSVISITCSPDMRKAIETTLNQLMQEFDLHIIYKITTIYSPEETKSEVILNFKINHIEKFSEFILENLGDTDKVKNELKEILV